MCMAEGADSWPRFYTAHHRKARKQHECHECNRRIDIGETYERASLECEGSVYSFNTCRQCVAARAWIEAVCGTFLHQGVLEDLKEHIEEGYNPRWLNIAVSGMQRKWRDKNGKLWRPMSLPKNLSPLPSHA